MSDVRIPQSDIGYRDQHGRYIFNLFSGIPDMRVNRKLASASAGLVSVTAVQPAQREIDNKFTYFNDISEHPNTTWAVWLHPKTPSLSR